MNNWLIALSIVIGPAGVILGTILNEHYRKKEKKFFYSEKYLERKVEICEKLYKLLKKTQDSWIDILEKDPDKETIINKFSKPVFQIADFLEQNALYINEAIALHIMMILVGFMDYPSMNSKKKRKYREKTNKSWKRIFDALREDLGFVRIDQELKDLDSNTTELKSMQEYLDKFKD